MLCSGTKCDCTFHVSCGIEHNVGAIVRIHSVDFAGVPRGVVTRPTGRDLWILRDTHPPNEAEEQLEGKDV